MRDSFPVRITGNSPVSANARILKFARPFDFIAGQVIGISIDIKDEQRLYSIASGNKDDEIWILYTVKADGFLTPALSQLKPGDIIRVSHPFGNFICDQKPAIWVATGTGIAPFASMFFSGNYHNKTLIQGNRDFDGLYFYSNFVKELGQNYHPCCSRISHPGCFDGRVYEYIAGLDNIQTDIPWYLCGIAEMVVDVRDLLISRGVPYNHIMAEIFF